MVRRCAVSGLLLLLGGCSGKMEAKAGNDGVQASADFDADDGPKQWDGDDETGEGPARDGGDGPPGRLVQDHAWDDRSLATLPGFRQFEDGSSRVFIEVTGAVEIKEREEAGKLIYRFEGVDVPEKVNRLSLPTMYFSTPVTLVEVKKVDGAAELHLHMRQAVKPKAHLKRTEGGTVLSLDFPKYFPNAQDTSGNAAAELQAIDEGAKK